MTWEAASALLTAIAAALAAAFAGLRNLRSDSFKRKVDESTRLLTGYEGMINNLDKQLDGVVEALETERQNRADERRQWAQERRDLHTELDEERRQRGKLYAEIDELRERLNAMTRQAPQGRARTEPPEEGMD